MRKWLRRLLYKGGATARFREWFRHRWVGIDETIFRTYQATFSTFEGQRVLQHLLDTVYCTVCLSNDPVELAAHNARRALVHEILENIDEAENPDKYRVKVDTTNILEAPDGMAR